MKLTLNASVCKYNPDPQVPAQHEAINNNNYFHYTILSLAWMLVPFRDLLISFNPVTYFRAKDSQKQIAT